MKYINEIVKNIKVLSNRHSTWQVFADFVEISAITISNAVDKTRFEDREAKYLEAIKKYNQKELEMFADILALLIMELQTDIKITGAPSDVLGKVFHELELHNKYKGQFFTPSGVSDMIGEMTVAAYEKQLEDSEYLTLNEPCVGSGAMVLGFVKGMAKRGYNYTRQLVVTAQDIDIKCVQMAYIQLSLAGIPAVIIHGDTLTVKEWSRWLTPTYIIDGWFYRQQCGMTTRANLK